ncbi:hypothetical protein C2845_PM01G44180 [Panicum miliaceum]|uniref:Uncharacterized protein n=1 Tax=Panicum miliaceum TaxID=4540 RepID=A0A3L6TXB5_PANMI|nr:hypothetical protein C2845_PM01G44180 [Panicum miliaceum]
MGRSLRPGPRRMGRRSTSTTWADAQAGGQAFLCRSPREPFLPRRALHQIPLPSTPKHATSGLAVAGDRPARDGGVRRHGGGGGALPCSSTGEPRAPPPCSSAGKRDRARAHGGDQTWPARRGGPRRRVVRRTAERWAAAGTTPRWPVADVRCLLWK